MPDKTNHNQRYWKEIPTEDDITEYGAKIFWSSIEVRSVKNNPNFTGRFVKVECKCGRVKFRNIHEVQYLKYKGLCMKCSAKLYARRGKNHTDWNGGKTISGSGYVKVNRNILLANDLEIVKSMFSSSAYAFEHRIIVALSLGRPLSRDEHVHHINKVKTDNRIENLQLVSREEHSKIEAFAALEENKRLRKILDEHGIKY